jgi:CopG family transcriptional regulator, nickel-responsive regulator
MAPKSQIVSVSMDPELLARFDAWVKLKGFPSRSNGLQHLLRRELDAARGADDEAPCVGTVTFVYDHHRRELLERLAHLQHEHLDLVVSSTHVHLDHDRCLETLVLRGPARAVRALGDRLLATRGVEGGELFLTPSHGHDHERPHDHDHTGPEWHARAHARPARRRRTGR